MNRIALLYPEIKDKIFNTGYHILCCLQLIDEILKPPTVKINDGMDTVTYEPSMRATIGHLILILNLFIHGTGLLSIKALKY